MCAAVYVWEELMVRMFMGKETSELKLELPFHLKIRNILLNQLCGFLYNTRLIFFRPVVDNFLKQHLDLNTKLNHDYTLAVVVCSHSFFVTAGTLSFPFPWFRQAVGLSTDSLNCISLTVTSLWKCSDSLQTLLHAFFPHLQDLFWTINITRNIATLAWYKIFLLFILVCKLHINA